MIGGKDDAGLTCASSVVEQRNLVTLGGAEVLSHRANMTNMGPSCGDLLHEPHTTGLPAGYEEQPQQWFKDISSRRARDGS